MKTHKIVALILAVIISVSLCACASEAGSKKIEGSGYKTAEEALEAYINAFCEQDIEKMMSCFAVESYAENYDLEESIEWTNSLMVRNGNQGIPETGDYSKNLRIKIREASVIEEIENQYITIVCNPDINPGIPLSLNDYDGKSSKMIKDVFEYDDDEVFSDLEFKGDFVDPEDLDEAYDGDKVQDRLSDKCDVYGAEKIVSVVAEIEFSGDDYYLMADAVRYNGKWYILSFSSMIGTIIGVSSTQAGILAQDWDE